MSATTTLIGAFALSCATPFLQAHSACEVTGQAFDVNTVDRTIDVKDDSGSVAPVTLDSATTLENLSSGAAGMELAEVNVGDWICAGSNPKRIAVVSRHVIAAGQTAAFARWMQSGKHGTIAAIEASGKRFSLDYATSDGAKHHATVEMSPAVHIGGYAEDPASASGSLRAQSSASLHVGDPVYVRGTWISQGSMTATLVLTGGFYPLAGTIESMDAVDETFTIRELEGHRLQSIHVAPPALCAVEPGERLRQIEFGDLQQGDPVLILTDAQDSHSQPLQAQYVLTAFGHFDGVQNLKWILNPLRLP